MILKINDFRNQWLRNHYWFPILKKSSGGGGTFVQHHKGVTSHFEIDFKNWFQKKLIDFDWFHPKPLIYFDWFHKKANFGIDWFWLISLFFSKLISFFCNHWFFLNHWFWNQWFSKSMILIDFEIKIIDLAPPLVALHMKTRFNSPKYS